MNHPYVVAGLVLWVLASFLLGWWYSPYCSLCKSRKYSHRLGLLGDAHCERHGWIAELKPTPPEKHSKRNAPAG